MNLNCDELQQLTALESIGALDGVDLGRLRERLESDAGARLELQRFLDVAAAMATTVPLNRPGPTLRAKVLDRIARTPQQGAGQGGAKDAKDAKASEAVDPAVRPFPVPAGFQFNPREMPWRQGPLPGVRFKVLSTGPDQSHAILEVELAPGASYPEHEHLGPEDMYVLTGDLQTEGMSLRPGDSFHADAGTSHDGLRSVNGCTALLIVSRAAFEAMPPI
ncbi:MAG: cupin domain-containing protein [Limisphaerales bacterium]